MTGVPAALMGKYQISHKALHTILQATTQFSSASLPVQPSCSRPAHLHRQTGTCSIALCPRLVSLLGTPRRFRRATGVRAGREERPLPSPAEIPNARLGWAGRRIRVLTERGADFGMTTPPLAGSLLRPQVFTKRLTAVIKTKAFRPLSATRSATGGCIKVPLQNDYPNFP